MFSSIYPQAIGLCAGALLLTSMLMVWRHSFHASITLLAAQGIALAALVAVIGVQTGDAELLLVAILVLALKGGVLPRILARQSRAADGTPDESSRLNPTAALLTVAGMTILSYVVMGRILSHSTVVTAQAAPIGLAMVLIGFLLLDNGIATVAFLTSGGVPLFLEMGISLDVLLVVLILYVFTGRVHAKFGGTDIDSLRELHD